MSWGSACILIEWVSQVRQIVSESDLIDFPPVLPLLFLGRILRMHILFCTKAMRQRYEREQQAALPHPDHYHTIENIIVFESISLNFWRIICFLIKVPLNLHKFFGTSNSIRNLACDQHLKGPTTLNDVGLIPKICKHLYLLIADISCPSLRTI